MAMASTSIRAAAPAPHSRSKRLDARIPADSVCLPPQPHKLAVEIREKRASSTTSRERPRRHRESKWWEVADKRQGTLLDDDSYVEEATPSSNFMDEDLRREIITYGDLSQACYDGFDNDRHSSNRGNCRYHPTELLAQSVAGLDQEYEITKYLYATTDLELPSIFGRPKEGEEGPWSRDSNWMGFVAVSRPSIGKRHIVVAWRGTVTGTEWLENLQDYLTPAGLDPSDTFTAGVKVESGFLDVYTASKASSRYNKLSARQQLICEVWRLKEKFRDEDVSITVTGHSLGGALALLSAYDLAELGLAGDTTQTPTTVVSFSAPRVGNRRFAERCKQLNLKVLRVLNKRDIVPKVPGILLNEQHRSWTLGEILPWAYWHVGTEFALDSGLSPFLRENADLTACHNLEGLLHLVDGYRGPLEEFRPSGRRDLALVNKDSDLLHPRLGIPSFWRSKSHSYQQIKHSSSCLRSKMKRAASEDDETSSKVSRMEAIANPGIQRYLVGVEYIGTHFSGWQKQDGVRTVQGTLEDAFNKFVGQPVLSTGSSRTDAGVHALRNVCHVDVARTSRRKPGEILTPHPSDVVVRAVNHFLKKESADVQVLDARFVPLDFHARFRAKERTYHYRILAGRCPVSLFERERAWHVEEPLNLEAMQSACKVFLGRHDFSSFRASGCQAASPVKTLDELSICETVSWPHFLTPNVHGLKTEPKSYLVTARAQSFLYHQVRLMVGTLKGVGAGKRTAEDVRGILEGRSISLALPMAPASGLFLADVNYDFDENGELPK